MTIKLKQLLHRLFRPLPPATPQEQAAIDQLRARLGQIAPPQPAAATSEAEREWCANRLALRRFLLSEDPRRFLWLDAVRHAMTYEAPDGARAELARIRARLDFQSRWAPCLVDGCIPPPGAPRVEGLSPNLIHQACHLVRFEEATGVGINQLKTIMEFGGGYGAMCRVARCAGFAGRYVVFDLPEFLALQDFYLALYGTRGPAIAGAGAEHEGISAFDQIKSAVPTSGPDLLIAMWSLSETPLAFRTQFLSATVLPRFFLLGLQDRFGEADNLGWFKQWTQSLKDYRWVWLEIPHLPGNQYLLGVRNDAAVQTPSR